MCITAKIRKFCKQAPRECTALPANMPQAAVGAEKFTPSSGSR
jgi:hypothetical protein